MQYIDSYTAAGYIFETGVNSANGSAFQQLVTIDSPSAGPVFDAAQGKQGLYLLSGEVNSSGQYHYRISTLPTPGNESVIDYATAPKQTYIWKSKKFVMRGRTTFAAAKVTMDKGCVRLKLYVDGCCRYDAVVQNCAPFRLPDQLAGFVLEIELIGTATIHKVDVASTIEELNSVR